MSTIVSSLRERTEEEDGEGLDVHGIDRSMKQAEWYSEKGYETMKKEYKKASMEMVNLSDDDLDSVSGGVGNRKEYDKMGMCSGYEVPGNISQASIFEASENPNTAPDSQ